MKKILLALGLSCVIFSYAATTTVFNDSTMSDTNWTWTQYGSSAATSTYDSANQRRHIVHAVVDPGSTGTVHKYTTASLNPATDVNVRNLTSIDMSIRSYFSCPSCGGSQLGVGMVAYQGTKRFLKGHQTVTGRNTWLTSTHTITRSELLAQGFDLSVNGAPIYVGFTTVHSAVFGNNIYIDDVVVTYTAPATIACSTSADCGTDGYIGSPTCTNGNVYQDYKTFTCNNAGTATASCTNSTTSQLKQTCTSDQTCTNGACVTSQVCPTGSTGTHPNCVCTDTGKYYSASTKTCVAKISGPCLEGYYYCHTEGTCKPGNDPCSTVTCNNNNTCETNESCNCPDCTNGGLDDKDYCAKVGNIQLICTKDTAQCRTDRFPYCLPFCLDGYVYDPVTSQCIANSSTATTGSAIGAQIGACCPPGSAWNSIEKRCVPDTCGEGFFYCASQKKCLPGGDTTCTTKTCNNNGTCENEESCDCLDCVNGGTDDKDRCSIIEGTQAICSDDNLTDNLPGACCLPPGTWNTISKSCTGCLSTQAPSELRAGIDQPYITCTGGGDATKTHFRYRIKNNSGTGTPFISEIYANGTQVLHSTMIAGVYTVECFYGTTTNVSTSGSADSCVKTMTVNATAQGCRRIYPYVGNTLSDEMIRENPFQASFRCGSRLSVEGNINNPYMFQVQGSPIAYLQFDALISELFNGLAIGPVSTQTQNYSFDTGTKAVSCAVKVGDGYSTNNACRLAACVGANCDNPQTFAIVHSGETMCTSSNTDTYSIGCNPTAPDVNLCVQWFREAAQIGSTTVPEGIRFPISFRFGNATSTPTQVYCIKYAAGKMPGGLNLSDNVVCTAVLNNGEQIQVYAADTTGTYSSLQTTMRTVELDKEDPTIAEIKYYTNDSLTTEVSNEYYYNKPVIALAVCTDTPANESVACACSRTVDATSNGADLWSQGKPSNLIGADMMSYTRTITETLSGAKILVTDTAGHKSPQKIIDFSIDTQKPTVTVIGTGTVKITANDTGSKIWKTTSAPAGATNANGIIYRIGTDRTAIAFDDNCNTTSVYAKRTEISGASVSVEAANISLPSGQVLSYCVKDNAGNVTKGFYPIETGACFSASNMSTIPTLSTYKELTRSRIELSTNTDAQKYGYTFSESATDATCFRGLLANNIATLVEGKYDPTIGQTTLSNWVNSLAKIQGSTTTMNTEGYYYYKFTTASNNTLSITENPSGAGLKTVIVDGGNIRITKDITYTGGDKYLLLIARKNTNGYGGNIEIDATVRSIDAILIADGGTLISLSPSANGNRLTVNGRMYSYNTRAGSLMASGTNLVDATSPKIYSFSTNTIAAGTISVAKEQDLERFRTIELDGTNTCTLHLNYYALTSLTLPPILRRPDGYTGGSCTF